MHLRGLDVFLEIDRKIVATWRFMLLVHALLKLKHRPAYTSRLLEAGRRMRR